MELSINKIKALIDDYEQELPEKISKRNGHCFEYSFWFFLNNRISLKHPEYKLVHGYLYQNNSTLVAHGWLRLGNFIYDSVFGLFDKAIAQSNNYEPIWEYSVEEASHFAIIEKNTGPWQPLPKDKTL